MPHGWNATSLTRNKRPECVVITPQIHDPYIYVFLSVCFALKPNSGGHQWRGING